MRLLALLLGVSLWGTAPAWGSTSHHHPRPMTFRGAQVTALVNASTYAAHCGGEVLIDRDDLEVLVAHCDR
jgi:hypothetical protein